jgi:ABC-2 type transport system permease protein
MLRSVFTKTLWDQRRSLAGWLIGISVIGVFYAAFYPVINTPELRAALEAYPEGFLDAIGFTDVTSAAGYLGSTTFGLLGPALVIAFASAVGGSAIAGEEESGRLDLILAHPVSRWSVVVQRFAAIVVAMVAVGLALAIGLVAISGLANLADIGAANLFAASFQLSLFGSLFGAIALAVGAMTGRRSLVYAVVAIVGVAGFFGNNLGPSIEGLGWLADVSPFGLYLGGEPLKNGLQVIDSALLAGASVLFVALGGLRFDRRDLAV